MSFGFGVGDFLAVAKLASDIRKDYVDAPDQFRQITSEYVNFESSRLTKCRSNH